MRKTRLSDFTGGDAIRLVIALYTVRELYHGFSIALSPKYRRWAANQEEKIRIRKAEETMKNTSSERQ